MMQIYLPVYVLSVVVVNLLFSALPPVAVPPFGVWPPASLIVGFVFILRDYAQREVGSGIWVGMLTGTAISYYMNPAVGAASAAAFLVSELVDTLIYTCSGRSFRDRILLSSLLSTPIDSVVFLYGIGHLEAGTFVLMTLSKLAGAFYVWRRLPA